MSIAAQLEADYGWRTTSAFTEDHLALLLQAARNLRACADQMLDGGGLAWLHRHLTPVYFHLGGAPQAAVSWLVRKKMSLVFPQRDIWLARQFINMANPAQHIIHELAHVLDNRLAGRSLPATFFGGGPADRLVLEMGGHPTGLRFANGTCGIPPANQWAPVSGGEYGNHSSADYFAEAFAWSLFYPLRLPSPVIVNWLKVNVFLAA